MATRVANASRVVRAFPDQTDRDTDVNVRPGRIGGEDGNVEAIRKRETRAVAKAETN